MRLLTNLLFEPKGMHNQNAAYNIKDTVMSADGSRVYFALQDVPVGIALDNEYYWKLQIDLSSSKSAMDQALASFGNYAKEIGMRVRGETANASGNPVTFLPDAGSLIQPVTVLEVQQQGSGDPYPAGSRKNKLDPSGIVGTQDGLTFAVNADGSITINGAATASGARTVGVVTLAGGSHVFSMRNNAALSGSATVFCEGAGIDINLGYADASGVLSGGNTVTVKMWWNTDAVFNGFVMRLMIETGSVATEYAPPSNIRPISGYDALGLTRCGDNLLNYDAWKYIGVHNGTGVFENNGVTITANNDDAYTNDGIGWPDVENGYLAKIPVKPGESITLSWEADRTYSSNIYIFPNADLEGLVVCNNVENRPLVYTATEGVSFVTIRFSATKAGDVASYRNIMVNKGTEAMPFKPWQGKTNTVQIGQTIYGGKFDWLTGKLTAEWAMKTLDGGPWDAAGWPNPYTYAWWGALPDAVEYGQEDVAELYCSHYTAKSVKEVFYDEMPGMVLYANNGSLIISSPTHKTLDAFKAALAASPVQIAYKLANPIEIQLTPHIISAADPEQTNTLYGDGSIEVEYVKPLHVSIEERVAAAVAAAIQ